MEREERGAEEREREYFHSLFIISFERQYTRYIYIYMIEGNELKFTARGVSGTKVLYLFKTNNSPGEGKSSFMKYIFFP